MKMFVFVFCTALLFLGSPTLAENSKNPFRGIDGQSMSPNSDQCEATRILRKAIADTGVNILEDEPVQFWECDKREYKKCPQEGFLCQSNHKSGFPAICVKDPNVVVLNREYADAGKLTERHPRFAAIHTIKKDASGFTFFISTAWEMDNNGCNAIQASVEGNSGSYDKAECLTLMNSILTGGLVYPTTRVSNDLFCDSSKARDYSYQVNSLGKVGTIAKCMELYPHLLQTLGSD
jgi:hypothetical protein